VDRDPLLAQVFEYPVGGTAVDDEVRGSQFAADDADLVHDVAAVP